MTTRVDNPPPRHVAQAVSHLGAEQVREAWRYLDAWQALAAAGVPRATLREALLEPHETQPVKAVAAWDERGLLCLVGLPGTGKTYAAARWVLSRHRRGLWAHWVPATSLAMLSFRDRDRRLEQAADASALVIDDLGAGQSTNDKTGIQDAITGLIQYRIDELLPTVVASNGTPADLNTSLGPRIADRCKVAGGLVQAASAESLRTRATIKLDGLGRGPEWYRAHRLVDLVGCVRTTRGEDHREDLDVGERLDLAARRHGYEPCRVARELLGLTKASVEVEAHRFAEAEVLSATAASEVFGLTAREFNLEGLAAALAEEKRAKDAAARAKSRAEISAVVSRARAQDERDPTPFERAAAPEWTRGPGGRKALKRLGFKVEACGERYSVTRKVSDASKVLATGAETEGDAWEVAGRLCAEIDTHALGDAQQ